MTSNKSNNETFDYDNKVIDTVSNIKESNNNESNKNDETVTNNSSINKCNETYILVKKMIPPKINIETITLFNGILNDLKLKKYKKNLKIIIGVIMFKDKDNIEYIHCPIVNVSNENIVIGVCNHFNSVINNKDGKKQIAAHKYQHINIIVINAIKIII